MNFKSLHLNVFIYLFIFLGGVLHLKLHGMLTGGRWQLKAINIHGDLLHKYMHTGLTKKNEIGYLQSGLLHGIKIKIQNNFLYSECNKHLFKSGIFCSA